MAIIELENANRAKARTFWLTRALKKSTQAGEMTCLHPLRGIRAAVYEPLALSRQALLHNLGSGIEVPVPRHLQSIGSRVEEQSGRRPIQLVLASTRSPNMRPTRCSTY